MGLHVSTATRDIWNQMITVGEGYTFIGPEFRSTYFPSIPYKLFYSRITYLTKLGVLEKTNTWTGENNVVYRVKDTTKIPRPLDLSAMSKKSHSIKRTGKALFAGITAQNAARKTKSQSPNKNIVDAADRVADELLGLLETAKKHPTATIKNFSTDELFAELSRRTSHTV